MTDHLKVIQQLEQKIKAQKHQLKIANDCLYVKNRELDALHYVWCDGGCATGIHRFHPDLFLSKKLVELAKVNTNRLIAHYNNSEFRKFYTPRLRKGLEVELLKNDPHDISYFFTITMPRKIYHKILKFFSGLVKY